MERLFRLDKNIQIIKNKEKVGKYCFYAATWMLLLVMILGHSAWEMPYRGRVLQLAFLLFCIKIVTTGYRVEEWLVMIVLGGLGSLSYMSGGEEYVVSIIVMIFSAKDIEMRKILKWIFYVTLIGTLCIICLSLLGAGGMTVDVRNYGRGSVEARWCLGFSHANNLHGTFWYLSALFVYLFFDRLHLGHYIGLSVLNIGLFGLTISKAGLITTQLLFLAVCIVRYYPKIEKWTGIYILGVLCVVGIVGISLISVTIPSEGSTVLQWLDRFFTGRISLAYQGANIVNWKPFTHIGQMGVVDNGWITVCFNYGYLIGILFVCAQIYLIYVTYKRKNGICLAILVTNTFYTFMEATYTMNNAYFLCNLSYVMAMVLMGEANESKRLKS